MTINQKGSSVTRVPVNTINTMLEQISDLQEDLSKVEGKVNALGNSVETVNLKANEATITKIVSTEVITDRTNVGTLTATNVDGAKITASDGNIDILNSETVNAGIVRISDKLETPDAIITDLASTNADITRLKSIKVETNDFQAGNIITDGINNTGNYTGANVSADTVTTEEITVTNATVEDTINVKDLNISGEITGIADVELNELTSISIKTTDIESTNVITDNVVMSQTNHLAPISPLVDNNDRYTIELPSFTGTVKIIWKDVNEDGLELPVWQAVVVGNGESYSVTWSTVGDYIKVTQLFNWDNKLFIRTSSNGSMYYSIDTTENIEEGDIHIYYNMGGWGKEESLEELCDESHQYVCTITDGTFVFGSMFAPGFTVVGETNFDELTVNKLTVNTELISKNVTRLKALEIINPTIIWDGVETKVCDNFTTDWVL